MERRGWIFALGALVLVAAGVAVASSFTDDDGDAPPARLGEDPERRRASHAGGPGSSSGSATEGRATARRGAGPVDGGPLGQVPTGAAAPAARAPSGNDEELPGNATDHEHSAGWRLGQARRRISILEPRLARYRARVQTLRDEGDTALAERQQAVVERIERRMGELRTQERELADAARADGTLDEAERGFEEGETDRNAERRAAQVQVPRSPAARGP